MILVREREKLDRACDGTHIIILKIGSMAYLSANSSTTSCAMVGSSCIKPVAGEGEEAEHWSEGFICQQQTIMTTTKTT